MTNKTAPDFEKLIRSFWGCIAAGSGDSDLEDSLLRTALQQAYKAGYEAGVDSASEIVQLKPYGTVAVKNDKISTVYWDHDALSMIYRDIIKLKKVTHEP